MNNALTIERITVKPDRISLLVRVAADVPRTSTPGLARRLLGMRPSLAHHACVNSRGTTFGAVIETTSLPHVLEHLVIDVQVRDGRSLTERMFVGTTEWLDEGAGLARVEVSYADDLVALRAVRNALALLNGEVGNTRHDSSYHVRQNR